MSKEDLVLCGAIVGIGTAIGAIAGFGLSFTALSPLIIGGIVASVFPALIAALTLGVRWYRNDEITKYKKDEDFVEKRAILASAPLVGIIVLTDIAIGVGLAAAANAIFPNVMLGMGSAALAGGVIGATALTATVITALCAAGLFADKIRDYACNPKASLKDIYIGKQEEKGYQSV